MTEIIRVVSFGRSQTLPIGLVNRVCRIDSRRHRVKRQRVKLFARDLDGGMRLGSS